MSASEAPRPDDGAPAVAATYAVEAVVAVLLLVLGTVVMYQSHKLGATWTSDGPGAGYFPFYIGLVLVVSSLGTLAVEVFGKQRNSEGFVDRVQLKRVLQVLLPAMLYVFVVNFLGLYVASAIYITLFMVYLGDYSWLKSVVAGLVVNVLFFMMFEVWFKVPLFKGTLNPLGFLGY